MSDIGRQYSFHDLPQPNSSRSKSITIGSASEASKIDMREWTGGSIQPGTSHSEISIYTVLTEDGSGTPVQAYDCDGAPIKVRKTDGSPVGFDPAVFDVCPWIWLISTTTDTEAKLFKKA